MRKFNDTIKKKQELLRNRTHNTFKNDPKDMQKNNC